MTATRVQFERILCPTDFSDTSSRALEYAAALAGRFEGRLRLLHVVPSPLPSAGGAYFMASSEMKRSAGEELERCAAQLRPGLRVESELREGEPWREIQAAAEEGPADLVVMGTHGRGRIESFLLGSVAEKVLRHTPCPVLTVGSRSRRATGQLGVFNRILCAVDLSEASAATLAFALSLAEEQQSELTLLHVVEGLHLYQTSPELEQLRRNTEEVARGQLAAAVPPEAREWCSVREVVRPGRAHNEILDMAGTFRADLIVMGTHGHGPLGRIFLGSTSQSVVRGAACPVVTVREVRSRPAAGARGSRSELQDLQPGR